MSPLRPSACELLFLNIQLEAAIGSTAMVMKKDVALATAACPARTTLAAVESLALPQVQELVFLADFRCARCQKRVAEIMSKMKGETQSVVISVSEKKVNIWTIMYPNHLDEKSGGGFVGFYNPLDPP
ncbi:uncharacterized protein LOC127261648 isoform X2 [Andrographis paniculata]|uniref:uncharacterized protein LOC127261648 isoform X2 n=1 Tax=Andrographis paniculata TaxID=175694 RepID=UPI0021E71724|nr:uncharacterized protein LOC127261648 isoform X2 [Andrographis paniculata]